MEVGPPVPQFPEYIIFLLENKNELNALLLLGYHHMLNLSELSDHLDRSKSNVMNYLEELEIRKLIQLIEREDLPKHIISKKGPKKYYQLSSKGDGFFMHILPAFLAIPQKDSIKQALELNENDFAQQIINQIQNHMQSSQTQPVEPIVLRSYLLSQINNLMETISYSEYQHRLSDISNMVLSNLSNLMQEETKQKTMNQIVRAMKPSVQLNELYHIPMYSLEDTKELGRIIVNFLEQLEEFESKQQSRSEEVQGFQHLYLFTGFLNESLLDKK